jgi:hypothetical protein
MPSFFTFHQGDESGTRLGADAAPLLGRFRAVPDRNLRSKHSVGDLFSSFTGSVGYGSIWRTRSGGSTADAEGEGDWDIDGEGNSGIKAWGRAIRDVWIQPQKNAVGRVLDRWWLRWVVMVLLPASIVCPHVCRGLSNLR